MGNYITFASCRVVSPSNRTLYITSIGWVVSMNLGVVIVPLSFIYHLVMLPVPMEPLSMPPVSHKCPSLHIESMLPTFSHHLPYALVQRNLNLESSIPRLSWLFMSVILGTIIGSCTFCLLSSSTLYNVDEYLMLVDGGCLNALLPADSIPSTSDHLLWNRSVESFECLKSWSHQW